MWHYIESGAGRPLILLHGIGMSGSAWNSVTPYLSAFRRVIVFDIAGFGLTPPLPHGMLPTSANLAAAVGERDWILLKGARRREALPAHARWIDMPGWGHVPMWIDPVGVAQLILDGTATGRLEVDGC
jgi:pimeloyl-ACP methyl ester carboxylesterase